MLRTARAAAGGDSFEDNTDDGETTLGYYVPPSPDGGYTVGDLEKLGFTEDDSGTIATNQVTLWVEAVKPSGKLGDQIVSATLVDPDIGTASYSVHLTAAGGDLLIDATNSTQPGGPTTPTPTPTPSSSNPELPTDTATLEAVKDQLPGKVIVINTSDKNGNGVPDFADGYGLDLSGVSGVTESLPDDTSNPSEHFVPLVLTLPPVTDPESAQVTLSYNGSDPGAVALGADSSGNLVFTPAPGAIRVWTKVGSYQDGQEASPRTLDNYVVPGATYTLAELGYTADDASADKPLILYVEAVRAGSGTITAGINVSDLYTISDTVEVTAVDAQAIGSAAYSGAVDLADGSVTLPPTTDISASGYGQPWGVSRTWTNEPVLNLGGQVGNGWSMLPYLIQGDSTVIVAGAGQGAEYFDDGSQTFTARFGVLDQLTYNSSADTYTLLDTSGDVTTFNGFGPWATGGALPNNAPEGAFLFYADPNGNLTTASYAVVDTGSSEAGGPKQYQLSTITHGEDTFSYVWNDPTGDGAVKTLGMLEDVTLSGADGTIESASFGYYSSDDDNGESNDLRNVTTEDSFSAVIGSDYYIYDIAGGADDLEYVFGSSAVARLIGDGFTLPLTSTDSTDAASMAPFADDGFSYGSGVALSQAIQGAGASSKSSLGAEGVYAYNYTTEGNGPVGVNDEQTQVVVSPPGMAAQTITMNFAGEMLSSSTTDADDPNGALDGKTWTTLYVYNPNAQITTVTQPSGLENVTDYYGPDDSGGPAGYVKDTKLVSPMGDGTGGGRITALQSYMTYTSHTSGSYTIYPVATSTVYASTASSLSDSSAETTSYSYEFNSLAPIEVTTTLPPVSDEPAGSGSDDTTTLDYNSFGWLTESVDADGSKDVYQYDSATGAETYSVVDSGGLNLATTTDVDEYGRPTSITDPNGDETGISYSDGIYDSSVTTTPEGNNESQIAPATVVDDNEEAGTVTTTGVAVGGAAVTETVESLDYAGRTVETDQYYNIALSQFYSSTQTFNAAGLPWQSTDNNGTITQDDYDNLGRETEVDEGTSLSNLTPVEQLVYDNNQVGDGNLTQDAKLTGPTAPNQVSQMAYNWEDQLIATQTGLTTTPTNTVVPDASTSAPITYLVLNNLGQTTDTLVYNGMNLSASEFSGVSTGSFEIGDLGQYLRAASSQTFDARGRVYSSSAYSVDPQNGLSGSATVADIEALPALTTTTTFDPDDNAVKTVAPTGLVTTTQYDGADRPTLTSRGAGTTVYSSQQNTYDLDGNLIATVEQDLLPGTPATYQTTYTAKYYDADNRITATANFGTTAPSSTYASAPPARSAGVALVTSETYGSDGFENSTTDPNGVVTEYYDDALGRPLTTIVNYGGTPATSVDETFHTYDGLNHTLTTTVVNNLPGGGVQDQTTTDIYGVTTAGGSSINSNDLLAEVRYPGYGASGAVATDETSAYDRQGDKIVWHDRDGNTHYYTYDSLGRETNEQVTPASGIDAGVSDLRYGFDSAGNPTLFTSYSGPAPK